MKLLKFLFAFILLTSFIAKTSKAQVTLTVTDILLKNSSGSLDSVLYEAIDSANTGNDVIVRFNASGLVQITAFLPVVNISQGSITFDKHPSASVAQGVIFTASWNDPTVNYGLAVANNDSSSWVLIKNLSFEDFDGYYVHPISIGRTGIYIGNSYNVEVTDCEFNYNTYGVYLSGVSDNALIHYNHFNIDTINVGVPSVACYYINYTNNYNNNNIYIDHNTVDNPIIDNLGTIPNGIQLFLNATTDSTNIHVTYNTINNCAEGIYVANHSTSNNDPRIKIFVNHNTVNSTRVGIRLIKAFKYWSVENNTFSSLPNSNDREVDLYMYEYEMAGPASIYGIDFIESNSLGYTPVNTGNQWLGSSDESIEVYGDHGAGVNLIGLDLPSKVVVQLGNYTNIRENRIAGPAPVIYLVSNGNDTISPPSIISAALYDSTLVVKYELNGNQHVQNNAEFAVDFYESNSSYHLKDYIGNQTIDSLTGGIYTASLALPAGLDLSIGDTIQLTVTAYGNLSGADTTIGTSPVAFSIIKPFACDDFSFHIADSTVCLGHEISLTFVQVNCADTLTVEFGDGNDTILPISATPVTITHMYDSTGTYVVSATVTNTLDDRFPISDTVTVTVRNCEDPPCTDCLSSFAPIPAKKYLLSAWVKEDGALPSKTDYTYPQIIVSFPSDTVTLTAFTPEGAIIDGWQRIEEEFTIPATATDITIQLNSTSGNCFFDDIRVFPFDGSLKSFVYDPISMKLVAELDERNYATLYEYDEEGKLVRVKKETAKGIMTIKENRNVTQK